MSEDSPQPSEDELRGLSSFAEHIAEHAGEAMLAKRHKPETTAEIALHNAYLAGLVHTQFISLENLEEETTGRGMFICEALTERHSFFEPLSGGLQAEEFLISLYKDDRRLLELWEMSPELGENTAYWQALHDVQTFADYFENHTNFRDDFRSIRTAVETSLAYEGLLDIWLDMVAAHKKISLSPSLPPLPRTGYPPPAPAS